MENLDTKGYDKFKKILFGEISFIASVVAIVFGLYMFLSEPSTQLGMDIGYIRNDINLLKQDVVNIKENHLTHIYDELISHDNEEDEMRARVRMIENNVVKILTILEKQ